MPKRLPALSCCPAWLQGQQGLQRRPLRSRHPTPSVSRRRESINLRRLRLLRRRELPSRYNHIGTAPSGTDKQGRFFQSFNPDLSLNADFLFHASSQDDVNEDHRPFRVREVELGLSGAVDPYGQYHIIIGLEEETPDQWTVGVEEAYFAYNDLPYDLRLRVGKFRASIGKVNDTHLHALPWIDYPRVITNYFGEEGLKGTGASLSWLVPNPWDHYLELTGEVFDSDNEILFAGEKSNDAAELVHLKSFWDLSASSTLELGLSAATAPDNEGHGGRRSWIEGADLTFRWRPPGKGLYQAFEFRNEILTCQKDLPDSMKTEDSWGMYSAAEYQFSRRWAAGVRYDYSERPEDRNLREKTIQPTRPSGRVSSHFGGSLTRSKTRTSAPTRIAAGMSCSCNST